MLEGAGAGAGVVGNLDIGAGAGAGAVPLFGPRVWVLGGGTRGIKGTGSPLSPSVPLHYRTKGIMGDTVYPMVFQCGEERGGGGHGG